MPGNRFNGRQSKYFDNKIVCDLIEAIRPPGVFSAMKDATKTAHADPAACDRTFMQAIGSMSNPHLTPRQGNFIIKHYAGDVDQDNRKQPPSAGDKIKASANDLVATLMKATPSYIRTIKPNENKSPTEYNEKNVLHQVKYLGLQENVRIRRAGFAYRQTFDKIRTYPLRSSKWVVTKAFIKAPETLFALEHMRDRYWHNMAARIQRVWRAFLQIRIEAATRIQRMFRKKREVKEFLELREKGHQILQGRKERRRYSLLGSRRFMGDYLGIAAATGPGAKIRGSINLPANEVTIFSCRGEILETKFGRSTMPGGGFNLKIGDSIEYAKKPGKMQLIKVVKDSQQRQDHYKSATIHTQAGEPPNSRSKPMPKGKPVAPKPFTSGRLIKPGGPGGRPSKLTNGNRPTPKPVPIPAAARPVPAADSIAASIPVHTRNPSAQSTQSTRAVPPPPPPAPPAPPPAPVSRDPQYRVLYAFAGQSANEFSLTQGEIVTVLPKRDKWLVAYQKCPWPRLGTYCLSRGSDTTTCYHSSNTTSTPRTSKAPPAKRPVAGRKPAPPPAPRDSGMSISNSGSGNNSGRSTPTPSLAGGLAEALRARQSAMQGNSKKEDDDDW
ncbi:hypothetical protein DID88_002330 [Monilinia fructigena]|uniref:Myosin motor domain-containing protein n=1 Tax=Monilinia fructigena TaxID=38457 RepID=A0A395ICX1_9HELO|nr:hypothetical protein DID88_002330 [Monilinia fructigena]